MSPWIYKGIQINNIDDIPNEAAGFIYVITNVRTGKIYIGKKSIYHNRKKKLTKKDKLIIQNKRKRVINIKVESDWSTYYGSSKELLSDIELYGKEIFRREILEFCYCSTSLTYSEVKWMFHYNVLEVDAYNGNIAGKYFRGRIKCNKNEN